MQIDDTKLVSRAAGGSLVSVPAQLLVKLAHATPDEQALVEAVLAGRVAARPTCDPPTGAREETEIEPFIKKQEVSERLGIKLRTTDQWMKDGKLVFYKVGRSVRFRWSEVQAHLAETSRVCRRSGRAGR